MGGSGNVDTGSGGLALTVGGSGASTSLSGVISGTGAVNKTGAGTWTLSGSNTFGGQLSVKAGAVAVASINNAAADGPLGNSALAVVLGDAGGSTGTLKFTGSTAVNTGLSASSTKKFTLTAGGGGTIEVESATTNLTLSGVIDGSGDLNKTNDGTLTLSGVNTFSGQLSVKAGTLATATINDAARTARWETAATRSCSAGSAGRPPCATPAPRPPAPSNSRWPRAATAWCRSTTPEPC